MKQLEHICDLSDVCVCGKYFNFCFCSISDLYMFFFCFVFVSLMWTRPKRGNARLSSSEACFTVLNSSFNSNGVLSKGLIMFYCTLLMTCNL